MDYAVRPLKFVAEQHHRLAAGFYHIGVVFCVWTEESRFVEDMDDESIETKLTKNTGIQKEVHSLRTSDDISIAGDRFARINGMGSRYRMNHDDLTWHTVDLLHRMGSTSIP